MACKAILLLMAVAVTRSSSINDQHSDDIASAQHGAGYGLQFLAAIMKDSMDSKLQKESGNSLTELLGSLPETSEPGVVEQSVKYAIDASYRYIDDDRVRGDEKKMAAGIRAETAEGVVMSITSKVEVLQKMKKKMNTNQLAGDEPITEQAKELQKEKKENTCQLTGDEEIIKQVQDFSNSKNWRPLVQSLEKNLPHDCPAYTQMKGISSRFDSPIFAIGHYGYEELMEVLLRNGGDVNMTDSEGYIFLHGAADRGDVELSKFLLDRGAYIDAKNKYGNTPLMYAAKRDSPEMVQYLVQQGASITAKDNSGNTAKRFAHNDAVKQYLS